MQVVWPLRRNLPWQWQVPHSCSKFPHSKGMQWDLHQMSPMYIIKCIKCLILQIEQVKWEADNLILKKVQGQKVFRNILRGDMQNGQNGLTKRLSLTVTKLDNKATEVRSGEPARSERVAPVFRPSNLRLNHPFKTPSVNFAFWPVKNCLSHCVDQCHSVECTRRTHQPSKTCEVSVS